MFDVIPGRRKKHPGVLDDAAPAMTADEVDLLMESGSEATVNLDL